VARFVERVGAQTLSGGSWKAWALTVVAVPFYVLGWVVAAIAAVVVFVLKAIKAGAVEAWAAVGSVTAPKVEPTEVAEPVVEPAVDG